ncbi:MAG: hypothetical protein R3Y27_08660, partial [Clostridia bacterium]
KKWHFLFFCKKRKTKKAFKEVSLKILSHCGGFLWVWYWILGLLFFFLFFWFLPRFFNYQSISHLSCLHWGRALQFPQRRKSLSSQVWGYPYSCCDFFDDGVFRSLRRAP